VNVYVKNLGDEITDERLLQEFQKFGQIANARIMADPMTGKSKGFGFVCFSAPEEATKAITEMNGRMLEGKPLYVALAQRKDVRRAQLEAQFSARSKLGVPPPQLMPPQGLFYQGMPRMIYPQQMMPRPARWNPQGQPQMMPVRGMNTYLMPVNAPRGGRGGRGGRGRGGPPKGMESGGRGRGGGQGVQGVQGVQGGPTPSGPPPSGQVKYTSTIRNQPQPPQQPETTPEPLTIKALAAAPEEQKKQMIGESLFPLIKEVQAELAGKITGMLLEMDNGELLHLLESREALNEKIEEALQVLNQHNDEEEEEEEES